jgi:putative peptide zinc metalloprotease protein
MDNANARSVGGDILTAAHFTDENILKPRAFPPPRGWRRALYTATFRRVNVGPSAAQCLELALVNRAKMPFSGYRVIATISRKGGVGKTTTTLNLGHMFATHRGDRVVAVDGNPDAGSLGYRVKRETTATVTNLLRDNDRIERYADVRAYTSQASSRLEVVASDDDPHISQALGQEDYMKVCDTLSRHYNLILFDTGTGVLDSATRGVLDLADQIVLVVAPSLDGARAASQTLDWLSEHGYGHLVKNAAAVINGVRGRGLVELDSIEDHFSWRCARTVRVPWDPVLEAGALTSLPSLKRATRRAYLELAAVVAGEWSNSNGATSPNGETPPNAETPPKE